MDSRFSRKSFEDAGIRGIPNLLEELKQVIDSQIAAITDSGLDSREKTRRFGELCETVVGELNELGHGLYSLDYGGDVVYERSSQSWGTGYLDRHPDGLMVEFRPGRTRVLWVIAPPPPAARD